MAVVWNATSGEPVAERARVADNLWTRFRGLMLARQLDAGAGLIIKPCGSIHMMFMRFPIDAVFFDAENRVTKVARDVKPWRGLAFGGRGAKGVVELPAGAAKHVDVGHELRFST